MTKWILGEICSPLVTVVQGNRIQEICNICREHIGRNRSKSIAEKDDSGPSNDGSEKLSLIGAAKELICRL